MWDRLFGSFEPEVEAPVYGLTKNIATYSRLQIAFHEWAAIARDLVRRDPLSVRLGLLFRPPGWSADGSTQTARRMRAGIESRTESMPAPNVHWVAAQRA